MTTDQYERDFESFVGTRFPGRFDPRLLQNVDNVGDGSPGLQKAIRNWVKDHLHYGSMDLDLDLNSNSINNLKSIDEDVWLVSTPAELQTAIDTIGAGAGIIILKSGTFTLTNTISVDQGGSYIIEGSGNGTIFDCNGNRSTFSIANTTGCVLRNFKIDATSLTNTLEEIINVNETSDNKVKIDNVTIVGDGSHGVGIELNSKNCELINCHIEGCNSGIHIKDDNHIIMNNYILSNDTYSIISDNGVDNVIIKGNTIYESNNCIFLYGNTKFIISENIVLGKVSYNNIRLYNCSYCVVSGNICSIASYGIYLEDSDYNIINNNNCYLCTGFGIVLWDNCSYNTICGNGCFNYNYSYGISIENSNCNNNTVGINTCLGNLYNYNDSGTNTFDTGLNNIA